MSARLNVVTMLCVVLFGFVCGGCESSTSPIEPELGEEFQLAYGQTAIIRGTQFVVRFVSVDEDSRCPEGMLCIWEGNAKITLDVSRLSVSLNTSLDPNEIAHGAYKLKLLAVRPYPKPQELIKPDHYRITLIVIPQ